MTESRPGTAVRRAGLGEREQARVESEAAERDQDFRLLDQLDLPDQVLATVPEFFRQRPVVGRRALDCRRQKSPGELQSVTRTNRFGPVRQPDRMDRPEEEVPRFIAGEDTTSPITPMSRGRKPHYQQTRARVPESRQRPAPVGLAPEAPWGAAGGFLTPGDETRASAAGDDAALEATKGGFGTAQRREYFPVSFPSANTWPRIAPSNCALVAPAGSFTSESSAYSVKTYRCVPPGGHGPP